MIDRRLDSTASLTAQINAAQRAAETVRPPNRRLLADPYSRHFVKHRGLRLLLARPRIADASLRIFDWLCGGLHAHIVCRARYADDASAAAITDGIDQLVLLGAGFDTTSIRRSADPVTVFEVDAPATQNTTRPVAERLLPPTRDSHIVWVACDFEKGTLRRQLLDGGLDSTRRSLFVWLGVTPYLTRGAIDATLADLAVLSAPGSRLVLDYIGARVVTADTLWSSAGRVTRLVARRGEPYRSGFTEADLDALLTANGFRPCEHLGVRALLHRYDPTHTSRLAADDWLAVAIAEHQ